MANCKAMPLVFCSLVGVGERLSRLRNHPDERRYSPEIVVAVTAEIENARLRLQEAEDRLAQIAESRSKDILN